MDYTEPSKPHPDATSADWSTEGWGEGGQEQSLRRVLVENGVLGWEEVIRLGAQIATQLDSFHKRGVCPHGAVCPESIVLTGGGQDYVLALPVVGAPLPYRAPETHHRQRGQVPDARADVFSLGVVLFEALAGNRVYPFRVQAVEGSGHEQQAPSYLPDNDLGLSAPGVPLELRRVIERATRLAPENRFESPLALADALRAVSTATSTGKRRAARTTNSPRNSRLRRWPVALALAAGAALFTLAIFLLLPPHSSTLSADAAHVREEALELAAPALVPEIWLAAENASSAAKIDLYRRARDQAWAKHLEAVANAAQLATAFDATGEAAFARANDAKARAEHLWEAQRVSDALRSLAEAKEFYLAALKNRRERWIDTIRTQLREETDGAATNLRPEDEDRLRALRDEVARILGSADPSPNDLRSAEAKVAELRHETAVALERAGKQMAARQRGADAVARAELALRSAEKAGQAFPALANTLNRGKEFLDAARRAVEEDPSQAVTLAEEATQRFRQAESGAERELARVRQMAANARRRARQADAEATAAATYSRAEELWQKGEQRERDWLQRKTAYEQAKVAFDEAFEEVARAGEAAAPPPRAAAIEAEPSPPPRVAQEPTPRIEPTRPAVAVPPPAPPAPAVAAVPPPPAAKPPSREHERTLALPQGPMPADLAASIQMWLRETCENLNRSLARSAGQRARCEELVVLDRRERSRVSVSYSLAQGSVSPEGIQWGPPSRRSATLDCSASTCRCVGGDGC
ncbi:MAG: hypothetical protein N3C12_15945 [Candidatus Binatia bacterium]|nr:hypothetical protein [Candidatus Binatia bacterium]